MWPSPQVLSVFLFCIPGFQFLCQVTKRHQQFQAHVKKFRYWESALNLISLFKSSKMFCKSSLPLNSVPVAQPELCSNQMLERRLGVLKHRAAHRSSELGASPNGGRGVAWNGCQGECQTCNVTLGLHLCLFSVLNWSLEVRVPTHSCMQHAQTCVYI